LQSIANILFFKGVWFGSLFGAGTGRPWLGLILLCGFAGWHFAHSRHREADVWLLGAAALTGFLLDTLFLQLGVLDYAAPLPSTQLAPFWIVVMWMNFALTLNVSMRWLQGRYALSALLGAVGGPLAYIAGVELDAAAWGMDTTNALVVIAAAWALAVPTLSGLAHRMVLRTETVPA